MAWFGPRVMLKLTVLSLQRTFFDGVGMAIVRFTCPECDEVFKVSGEPAQGKKVKCPACKHAFVPTPDEEEDDEDDVPVKKKKKKKKPGGTNVLYWVYRGGSVVVR